MVEFSDQAFADLRAIEQWIANENPRVAREKAEMLADICELLDSSPNIGTPYVDQIRHHTKEAWVIIYRPTEAGVYIYRGVRCSPKLASNAPVAAGQPEADFPASNRSAHSR